MKSNHHGTYTSNCDEWMNAVDPQIVFTHASDWGEATFGEDCFAKGREYYTVGLDGLLLITRSLRFCLRNVVITAALW